MDKHTFNIGFVNMDLLYKVQKDPSSKWDKTASELYSTAAILPMIHFYYMVKNKSDKT